MRPPKHGAMQSTPHPQTPISHHHQSHRQPRTVPQLHGTMPSKTYHCFLLVLVLLLAQLLLLLLPPAPPLTRRRL
jgi:hypothetical protein